MIGTFILFRLVEKKKMSALSFLTYVRFFYSIHIEQRKAIVYFSKTISFFNFFSFFFFGGRETEAKLRRLPLLRAV